MELLERTGTNAATDSKGQAFGLSGNLFLYPIAGVVAALSIATVCFGAFEFSVPISIALGIPFALVPILYVYYFKRDKPRGYDRDWLDNFWSPGFSFVKSGQPSNPRYIIKPNE